MVFPARTLFKKKEKEMLRNFMSKKIKMGRSERSMSQHLKTALKGELTRFVITRQIPCAIGGALSNVA